MKTGELGGCHEASSDFHRFGTDRGAALLRRHFRRDAAGQADREGHREVHRVRAGRRRAAAHVRAPVRGGRRGPGRNERFSHPRLRRPPGDEPLRLRADHQAEAVLPRVRRGRRAGPGRTTLSFFPPRMFDRAR